MASVLNNELSNISAYVIVDCRYPYEYEGGHVQVCFSLNFIPVCLSFTPFSFFRKMSILYVLYV